MKADDEKLYKELNEKELTRYQLLNLTFGMKELAEAIGAHNAWETLRHTREAIRHLQEFRGEIIPTPKLTEDMDTVPPLRNLIRQWKKNDDGDYTILIDRRKEGISVVSGKIIRCPVVVKFNYQWRTKQRWLLIVDSREFGFYHTLRAAAERFGFYHTLRAAAERFEKDCRPKGKPMEDDWDGETYCWHKVPYGPGPYCTGCGGLINLT